MKISNFQFLVEMRSQFRFGEDRTLSSTHLLILALLENNRNAIHIGTVKPALSKPG